jgi:three-Cys-motif partner protein
MKKQSFNPIIPAENDSLYIDEVGAWAESKYKILGHYCNIFTAAIKNKWPKITYIDLFSGCGYSKIKESDKIILGSPLINLSLPNKFTNYIFCEESKEKYSALLKRIDKINCEYSDIKILNGNCNKILDKIISLIPNSNLSFCFVDPYNIEIEFQTIARLGEYKTDFLILLAIGMDAKRNFGYYIKEDNDRIDKLLNNKKWREKFLVEYKQTNSDFTRFIATEFNLRMKEIGYEEPENFQPIRSTLKNLPLYHLAFYSKHPLGNKFWIQVKRYYDKQHSLF